MKNWTPILGERFWWIRAIFPQMHSLNDSISIRDDAWLGNDGDLTCLRNGNVFKTRRQALSAGKAMLKALAKFQKTEENDA